MSDAGALKQAQEKIAALLEAAKTGAIIPIRLPAQIDEIGTLLKQAEAEEEIAIKEAKAQAGPTDMKAFIEEESYFISHAIHELNTPLTNIRGYSDMLVMMPPGLSDSQKQFMDVVKTNVLRQQALLSDIRYLNKVRKGTQKLEPKMDMFSQIAQRLEKDLKTRVTDLKRNLEFQVPSGLPYLMIDTTLLAVALTKLVENGLQYSKEGEGKVTVTAEADNGYLLIKVADNGIGMTEEELSKLGQLYFRGEREEVIAFKGSGVGIPLAYGIIKLLEGTISVESKVDVGTTFTIRIKGMS
jgi:two-component system, OmpR family, sensor histidine kinase BaeS